MFDEAFGHKSVVTAVMNTLSLWAMGLFLWLVAHWPLLTRWLKRTSMKPGEGDLCIHVHCPTPDSQEWSSLGGF